MISPPMLRRARELRREMTAPERLLWGMLRRRQTGLRFRHEHPVGPYVLDFYYPAGKLAIEVDGFAHDLGDRPQRDECRTEWLKAQGIEVLRIHAKEVLVDPDTVADALLQLCIKPLHHPASPDGPPPRADHGPHQRRGPTGV